MTIFRINVLTVLLEYIDLFKSEWQHKANIWEGHPAIYYAVLLYLILSLAIVTK